MFKWTFLCFNPSTLLIQCFTLKNMLILCLYFHPSKKIEKFLHHRFSSTPLAHKVQAMKVVSKCNEIREHTFIPSPSVIFSPCNTSKIPRWGHARGVFKKPSQVFFFFLQQEPECSPDSPSITHA